MSIIKATTNVKEKLMHILMSKANDLLDKKPDRTIQRQIFNTTLNAILPIIHVLNEEKK